MNLRDADIGINKVPFIINIHVRYLYCYSSGISKLEYWSNDNVLVREGGK